MRCTNCQALPGFPCTGEAVALYQYRGGNVLAMCRYALDLSLDIADDEPALEPEQLTWLLPERTAEFLRYVADDFTGDYALSQRAEGLLERTR